MERLLEVKDLRTSFFTYAGEVKAVDGVSFHVDQGEAIKRLGWMNRSSLDQDEHIFDTDV